MTRGASVLAQREPSWQVALSYVAASSTRAALAIRAQTAFPPIWPRASRQSSAACSRGPRVLSMSELQATATPPMRGALSVPVIRTTARDWRQPVVTAVPDVVIVRVRPRFQGDGQVRQRIARTATLHVTHISSVPDMFSTGR
ncbi:hypothetical protein CD790_06300 [Streptomyces sp. SAJ15]|nr:hypothetical protein CD790_06300 [Streptomyces sp. SAJ15]